MDAPLVTGMLGMMGPRLRRLRKERGLSQEMLAAPEYTKSYISALERSKARPSLKALDILARRLGVPMTELLPVGPAPDADADADPAVLERALADDLDEARILLYAGQAKESLRVLTAGEVQYRPVFGQVNPRIVFGFEFLTGVVHLRLGAYRDARRALAAALALALEVDAEATARARVALGEVYRLEGSPSDALEYHRAARDALVAGAIHDPALRLSIYHNLAEDYLALQQVDEAMRVFQQAADGARQSYPLNLLAAQLWEGQEASQAAGDTEVAQDYARRASAVYELLAMLDLIGRIRLNFVNVLLERGAVDAAEEILRQAADMAHTTGDAVAVSTVNEYYARLELARGRVAEAAVYAEQSLQPWESPPTSTPSSVPRDQLPAYSRALATRAEVAERAGEPAQADARFTQALALAAPEHVPALAADLEQRYAELLVARGMYAEAAQHFRESLQRRQRHAAP